MKRQHKEWKGIFTRCVSDAKLVSGIYKKTQKPIKHTHKLENKPPYLKKNGDGTEKNVLKRRDRNGYKKFNVVQYPYPLGKCK